MQRPWAEPSDNRRTVLVFALAPLYKPHFETELEIIVGHQNAGDDVHVILCHRGLSSCLATATGRLYACVKCTSRAERGLDLAKVLPSRRHHVTFEADPPVDAPRFSTIDELKEFTVEGNPVGTASASSLISIVRDSHPDTTTHARLVHDLIQTAAGVFRRAVELITELRPDLVYIFNGRFASTAPVVWACQRVGVEFVCHEAAYDVGSYRLVRNETLHNLDVLKQAIQSTWQESPLSVEQRCEIGAQFFTGRRIGGSGDAVAEYQFAREQHRGLLPAELEMAGVARRIAIFNSSEDEFAAVDTYNNPVYRDQLDALDAVVRHPWSSDTQVIVREHPNLKGLRNAQSQRLRALDDAPNVTVITAESRVDSYALIDAVDTVVTFGSTMGAEAVFWGRPSILVGRAMYEDLEVIRPMSHKAVIDAILTTHEKPDGELMVRYGFFERCWSLPFEHFDHETLRTGRFDDTVVRPGRLAMFASIALEFGTAAVDGYTRDALISSINSRRNR